MNILIIKLSPIEALNSSTMRTIALAKGFEQLGAQIDYLTIPMSNTHTKNKKANFTFNILYTNSNKVYDNVVSNNNNKYKKFITNIARQVYHKFNPFNYTKAIADQISIDDLPCTEYDYVISVSDPKSSHIAARNLIKQGLKVKKWIQYWGDPLALDITNENIYGQKILTRIEKKLFSFSDLILYASPVTLNEQKQLFPKYSNKMKFISTPYVEKKIYDNKKNIPINIGYFGSYSEKTRNILPLYNAVKEFNNMIKLTIVGDSNLELESTENIDILPRQNIETYEENSNLLICIMNKKGTQIPGKFFQYSATNKPILIINDGEYSKDIKNYFKQFDRYYFCDNDEKSISDFLNYFMSNEVRSFESVDEFNSINIARKVLEYIE